ncbi:NAD(P)-dependent alcohol dehydrogenase [Angustibacter speluncae]
MRASVLTARRSIELQERPVPEPGLDDVLVRVRSVGVCGSDVHYYKEGRIGSYVVDAPLVLGHEVSGVVVGVGRDVPEARVGERVAIEPQRPCRRCRACKAGRYNMCPHLEFYATPPVDGAFCDYVVAPADMAHPVPDTVSDHAAALLEPFSVALWACTKAKVGPGSRVLVTGAGPIGSLAALAARANGATEVVVTDLVQSRRERVLAFGATRSLDPRDTAADLDSLGADAFIECTGATPALLSGLRALRESGTAVLVGLGDEEVSIPVQLVAFRELVLTGVFRYVDTWPVAIAAAEAGTDLDGLVTAEFDLEDTEAALNADDDPSSMKSVVVVSRG